MFLNVKMQYIGQQCGNVPFMTLMLRITSCKQHFMEPLLHIPELLAAKRLYSNSCGLRDFPKVTSEVFDEGKEGDYSQQHQCQQPGMCHCPGYTTTLTNCFFSVEPNCLCPRRLCPCGRGWIDHKNWSVCPTHCLRPTVSWSGLLWPLRVCCCGKVRNTEDIQLMFDSRLLSFILGMILETKSN